jgi:hypothetical protein
MAATAEEVNKNLDLLFEGWKSKFTALYLPVREMKRLMFKRIFGTGNKGGTNTAGNELPTKAYSTKPIYVSPRTLANAPSQFKKGKNGDPIESLYFPRGYAQLKQETSRKLPLELTGKLKGGFLAAEVLTEGLEAAILFPESEVKKKQGLEAKYGPIFLPTKEEQDEMLQDHAEELVQQIINAMNKS